MGINSKLLEQYHKVYTERVNESEIKINVSTFLRLLEYVREEIQEDPPIHDIAEICELISKEKTIDMSDYNDIVQFVRQRAKKRGSYSYSSNSSKSKRNRDLYTSDEEYRHLPGSANTTYTNPPIFNRGEGMRIKRSIKRL